mmetsp:Transcript_8390/g.18028  ORF Transcript_8390/g.18028 Transcript_8390/m.18028 type:complete len:230 (-) Transcript_8390:1686-2375(-)
MMMAFVGSTARWVGDRNERVLGACVSKNVKCESGRNDVGVVLWRSCRGARMCAMESTGGSGSASVVKAEGGEGEKEVEDTNSEEDKALLKAALDGEVSSINTALTRGGSAKASDANGRTALHFVAAQGIQTLVETLLEYGAPINAQDALGLTPLHMAAGYKRPDTVKALLEAGGDVTVKNNQGMTPLELARTLLENAPDKKFLVMPNKDKPTLREIVELLRKHEPDSNN